MEPLVKEIIAMDMAARNKVEQAKQARSDVKKQAELSKAEIEAQAMQEAKMHLANLKEQYEKEFLSAKQKSEAKYAQSLAQLQEKFQNARESWLKDIVERCIHE